MSWQAWVLGILPLVALLIAAFNDPTDDDDDD